MNRFLAFLVLAAGALTAQTAETIPFRAILLPSNEVPPLTIAASGAATVWLHVVRDASGRVTSASTDFNVSYQFPGETRLTGLHIHDGAAGVNGPVTIDSGITAAASVAVDSTGRGLVNRQGQTLATNTVGLNTANGMLTNPSGFYVNLHTVENPGGAIRGQLMRAESVVLIGLMNPRNEVPAITDLTASGVGAVIALLTRGANGAPNSGQVIFDLNYTAFPEGTRFTGFHIHDGAAGINGPVTINTGVQGGENALPAQAGGGNLQYEVEVPISNAMAVTTLNGLFRNPAGFYINLHTMVYPGGAIRSQLRTTDTIRYPVSMLPSNEVPPITGLEASAPALLTAHTLRGADGAVAAGVVIFDINHRFPGATTFTGLHIHDGAAGVNGPVTINTGVATLPSETGFGNIYRAVTVSSTAGLATLNSMVLNPENQYVNLHTMVNPGGAVRAQLTAAQTRVPTITSVTPAVTATGVTAVAPGGLVRISGTDLVKVASDVMGSFNGVTLPSAFNGTQVTIGGRNAPVLIVSGTNVIAQVPVDVPVGLQTVVVRNANGNAAANMNVSITPVAPAIFSDGTNAALLKNSDFSLVTATNRVRTGDIVVVYSTGLGVTTAALTTGQITPSAGTFFNAAAATVTVGGRDARVYYSIASPGFAGLYQTAFQIPEGAGTGSVPVVLRVGTAASNSVNISLQ